MRATMTDRVRAARVMALALAVTVLGSACGGDSPTQPGGGPNGKSAGNTPAPGPWGGPTGTIAYVRNDQLRLIEPDGSGDRAIWTAPPIPGSNLTYTVTFPAWRPDGGEI